MGSAAMCSKDPQLKARFYECEKAMKDIRNRIPSQGGLLSAIMNRSEVKRLISEANNIIAVHNQLLEDAKKIEDECQKEWNGSRNHREKIYFSYDSTDKKCQAAVKLSDIGI